MSKTINNPVLKGFHPDPSICRVGEDYYIASSTFCWFPGVRIHHSKDLRTWVPAGYALDRPSQLDLMGVEDNGGIWAPCLSYCDNQFYLIYTNTRRWTSPYKDSDNYVVTAPSINGPWSEPSYLVGGGFDPSLFHDDDGKKYLVFAYWDHRPGKNPFGGIKMYQYDPVARKLIGNGRIIFNGTDYGLVEAPHLYKKDGYYYLLTAEGGTSWDHVATVARSKSIDGPYAVMPHNPLCTSRYDDTVPLQRAGHGSLVDTQEGDWYFAHLCGRPVMPERKCILGRETSIQKVNWPVDDWPIFAHGDHTPQLDVPAPDLPDFTPADVGYETDDFDTPALHPELNTLRLPADDTWINTTERPGYLRIYGQDSLASIHRQSIIARRITDLECEASCAVEFEPDDIQQMAGLLFYYDTTNHHYLHVTYEDGHKILQILTCDNGELVYYPHQIILAPNQPIFLKGELHYHTLQFYYATQSDHWQPIGRPLDATIISDEHKCEVKFTGAFAGLCVQDMTGSHCPTDFDWFALKNIEKMPR